MTCDPTFTNCLTLYLLSVTPESKYMMFSKLFADMHKAVTNPSCQLAMQRFQYGKQEKTILLLHSKSVLVQFSVLSSLFFYILLEFPFLKCSPGVMPKFYPVFLTTWELMDLWKNAYVSFSMSYSVVAWKSMLMNCTYRISWNWNQVMNWSVDKTCYDQRLRGT